MNIVRKQVYGALGLALALSSVGTAPGAALKIPLPERKPVFEVQQTSVTTAGPALILPKRKPGMEPATALSSSEAVPSAATRAETSLIERVFGTWTSGRRLSEEDAARYAHIFAFQDNGEFFKADREIAKLQNRRLMGHVLAHRYLHPSYATGYDELAAWMKSHADHPQAQKIYDLARKKQPKGASALPLPQQASHRISAQHDFDVGPLAQPYIDSQKLSPKARDAVRKLRGHLGGSPTAALKMLESPQSRRLFTPTQQAALKGEIAESYFYNGKADKAFSLAAASSDQAPAELPMSGWIAGLSAWKHGKYETAARYFERAASSTRASAWISAAGAHWAARSWLRARQPQKVSHWLHRAAAHPRTFYGIISMKALGLEQSSFNWDMPELTDERARALSQSAAGKRALALADAGQPELARAELARLSPGRDALLQEAMIALAHHARLPDVSMRLGSAFTSEDGNLYDAALYPDAPWAPEKGFEVDRALVYAFIRQESKFDAAARNRGSGATGLMQLMPATAQHVARASGRKVDGDGLQDPLLNIDLGQTYLAELLSLPVVDNNLFRLAVAYNAGPGKLTRWEKEARYEDDPLLFIESIPAAETRIFVERVLTNFWIYRIKFGQDTPSLDRVAQGDWPIYVAQDIRRGPSFAAASFLFSR